MHLERQLNLYLRGENQARFKELDSLAKTIKKKFNTGVKMSNNDIQNYLPHRYPFLLIDKIIEFKEHDYLIAQKMLVIMSLSFKVTSLSIQFFQVY